MTTPTSIRPDQLPATIRGYLAAHAASAGGAVGHPAWFHNLSANPDDIRIELDARSIGVRAQLLGGSERDRAWQQITATAPRFATYQRRTDRELPVIRLTERQD